MPNLLYMAVQALFLGSLSLWTGGAGLLGLLVGPVLAGEGGPAEGRRRMAEIARQFQRLAALCATLALGAATARFILWESAHPFVLARLALLFCLWGLALGAALWGRPGAGPDGEGPEPSRPDPNHRRQRRLLAAQFVGGLVVFFLA